jgi:hypothetical protein
LLLISLVLLFACSRTARLGPCRTRQPAWRPSLQRTWARPPLDMCVCNPEPASVCRGSDGMRMYAARSHPTEFETGPSSVSKQQVVQPEGGRGVSRHAASTVDALATADTTAPLPPRCPQCLKQTETRRLPQRAPEKLPWCPQEMVCSLVVRPAGFEVLKTARNRRAQQPCTLPSCPLPAGCTATRRCTQPIEWGKKISRNCTSTESQYGHRESLCRRCLPGPLRPDGGECSSLRITCRRGVCWCTRPLVIHQHAVFANAGR